MMGLGRVELPTSRLSGRNRAWPGMTSVDFPRFRPYLADRRWPHVIQGVEDLENHNAIGRLASRSIEVELSRGPALNKTRPRLIDRGLGSRTRRREMSVVANKFEPILVRLNVYWPLGKKWHQLRKSLT
jgi:hypothetical protein